VVGNLSDKAKVLLALGLKRKAQMNPPPLREAIRKREKT
jgi:hypothetical protein